MNVLVLNGSPKAKDSNALKLANAFIQGAGWADAEILNVAEADIKPCRGCFACWNQTPGKCVIRDDMDSILEKRITADVIIWAFPLYYFNVPGGLKNLIDRQLPMNLPFMSAENETGGHPSRYDVSHQRHIVLSVCGFWTVSSNYDGVLAMFNHCFGTDRYAKILCGQGELFRVPELRSRTDEYLETVRRAGAEFAAGGISHETQAALAEPLYPREVFEKMADASWGIEKKAGAAIDASLSFTTQMAALYRPDGAERVIELHYTDIGKTYQMILTKQGAEVITDHFRPYTTRIETPYTVWRSIARGETSGPDAMYQRKYKVLGDFDVMLRWDDLFGGVPSVKPEPSKKRRTNMTVLLFPWIAIWIVLAINAEIGAIIGILAAAALPLAWLVYEPVMYEQISIPLVAGLSLAVLLGAGVREILPLSYGIFGLMWLASIFAATPLTAYYSANHYGCERAFANPLFMRTNRILTALWGILYILTMVWTFALMGTAVAAYTGLINSAIPALMGIFTAWYQKWYPASFAKRG